MNVAIVDDSLIDRQHLYHGLERYCREHKVHMKIEQFDNGTDFLNTFNANVYNLVFLDIFLNEIDGMQVAKSIFDQDPQCLIIFTTSSKEHAVTAFRLHALDYLLKPFSYEYLEEAMLRYERASKRFEHYIELKEGRHYTRILLSFIPIIIITISKYTRPTGQSALICLLRIFRLCWRRIPNFYAVTATAW